MMVFVKGKSKVDLTSNDYICEGGQGKIYSKGNLVYKIYHDYSKMIPTSKIQELSVLSYPNIIKPEDVLCDSKNNIIGYTMKFVPGTHPLCKLFTKSFRQRENVSDSQILRLVNNMRDTVENIHKNNILIVDLNEMNFLVSPKFDSVFFIDVDSYQTKNFPATVLMESVRDRHMHGTNFTQLTDWFSFAVVTFQLFIGIHPYKGKHPKYTGSEALNDRMKDNISVFCKDVTIPAVCNPFTSIPKNYLEWYKKVFDKGERIPPPSDSQSVVPVFVKVGKGKGSNFFDISEVAMYDKDIVNYFYSFGKEIVVTEDSVYCNGRQYKSDIKNPIFCFTPKMNHPVGVHVANGCVKVYDLVGEVELYQCAGKSVMTYDNRIYVQNSNSIVELEFIEGQKILVGTRVVGNCLEKATQMFDGVVVQNLLGSCFVSLFPQSKTCHQINIRELNGYQILDAKFDKGVLMVVGVKSGNYDRFVLKFDNDWTYTVRIIRDVTYSDLNFTVLDNKICVCINEEDGVEMFFSVPYKDDVKEISDPYVNGSMKLFHNGVKVLFAKGNKIFSMSVRK